MPITVGNDRTGYFHVNQGYDNVEDFSLDVPIDGGSGQLVKFDEAEWITRDADGVAVRVTGTSPEIAWPVITGSERYDYEGSGSVTVAMGVQYHAITTHFDLVDHVVGDYVLGTKLTVRLVGAGADARGLLTPADAGEPVFAICMGPVKLNLMAEDVPVSSGTDPATGPTDQLGNKSERVIEIQVLR
jgi:hypothetical protein